ncbi:MAG: hypothetical protein KC613_28405, partial [Myxococcales bacterium]|nr:hypothetical protein [Myxococcales bacterium]
MMGPVQGGLAEAVRPLLWGTDGGAPDQGAVRDWLLRPGSTPVPHRALAAALAAAAGRLPVLLFLDGLDQASEAEREALGRLVEAVCRLDCPVVVLVTARRALEDDGGETAVDGLLAGQGEVALRRLEGLGRAELEQLCQQVLVLHPDAARAVARAAAGRPLHAVMSLAALRAEGALERVDGVHRLSRPMALPSSLGDVASRWLASVFARRADGPRLRDLAERLAVLGQGAPFDLAVELGRTAGLGAEVVERAIDRLLRLGILEDARDDAFVIRHPVIWKALRRQASARTDAAALHLQAAEAHQRRGGPLTGDEAATVAAHFRAAGRVGRAVEALLEAGQRARRAGALTRASARFARALRWLDQAVDGPHLALRAEALLGRAEVA